LHEEISSKMRAVVAHAPDSDIQQLRQTLLGAGLECALSDCVIWSELAVRLAQTDADVVIINVREDSSLDWDSLREATSLVTAPMVAVGTKTAAPLAAQARRAGAAAFLDEDNLRDELDSLLNVLASTGGLSRKRGKVISVLAPSAGSGGSTVAVNLAGMLAKKHPREVALVELSREAGDVALLLNATPKATIGEVCQRWQTLDTMSLGNAFLEHDSGLRLLVHSAVPSANEYLNVNAVRRICVLTRVIFPFTVVSLDSRVDDEQFETMRLSDTVLLVVRADVPAVRRARWAVDAAVARGVPRECFRLVINRWGQGGQLRIDQVESGLDMSSPQLIPDDPARVNNAANQGVLLQEVSGRAKISRRIAQLADSLNGNAAQKKKKLWSLI
jgi:pilus assembly protein CpaE